MELKLNINCQAPPQTWRRRHTNNTKPKHTRNLNSNKKTYPPNPKTLNPQKIHRKSSPFTHTSSSSYTSLEPYKPLPQLELQTEYDHSHALPHQKGIWRRSSELLFQQTPDVHQEFRTLVEKLEILSAVDVLLEDGDWSEDQFWVAVRFLKAAGRSLEVFSLFSKWKSAEVTRVDGSKYEKVICLLCEEGHVDDALTLFGEMKNLEIKPSSSILYTSIICGLAKIGDFGKAVSFLDEMSELGLVPDCEVFRGLIEGYGKYNMYDEIGECMKKMESAGCSSDSLTCNLLIREFSRGGLVKRMERVYQMALSKKVILRPTTSMAMLDTYAKFGPIDRMEKMLRRVMNTNARIKDSLVRKVAEVYIENYMFSRLDDLGLDLSSRDGTTDLIWCLRLLSHACLLSRKGLDSVIGAMEAAGVSWNVTTANILLFTYLKMKDFTHLRFVLHDLVANQIKPDMVTIGILFDAIGDDFDGAHTLRMWQRVGFLSEAVEMNTDSLVLTAFGKGRFLKSCEDIYSRIDPDDREGRVWTYKELIDLVRRVGG